MCRCGFTACGGAITLGCRVRSRLASQWEGRPTPLNCSPLTLGLEQSPTERISQHCGPAVSLVPHTRTRRALSLSWRQESGRELWAVSP